MRPKPEIFISTDVETEGPIPGVYSMLSFASVAYTEEGKEVGVFKANLEKIKRTKVDPNTQIFWDKHPEAYLATREATESPEGAMLRYVDWLEKVSGDAQPVFVGYPATWDFMFIFWHLIKYVGHSPFGFSALDIKTAAMMLMETPFRSAIKSRMPKDWFEGAPDHTHDPLDDAREQGMMWLAMRKDWLDLHE